MKAKHYDVLIIGGGAGGLVTAVGCNSLGFRVALIDKAPLGGDCLHTGCVPSKTLIKAAKVAHSIRTASQHGIDANLHPVKFSAVAKRIADVIATIGVHDSPERFRALGIDVYFGSAQFTGRDTVNLQSDSEEHLFTASRFVIATGSRAAIPDIPGLATVPFLTNHEIFSLSELPQRLVILGAGPIGIELGQAFQRLGSSVTIINAGDRILAREDSAVAAILEEQLTAEGMHIVHQAKVLAVSAHDVTVTTPSGELHFPFDKLLVATGRTPNVENLGLEAAGVAYTARGITTNKYLQTTNKRIFAVGDIAGPYQFTHMAEYQAGIAVWNISVPWRKAVDYRVVPWVTYTDPELARVGLSEAEAIAQRIPHTVHTVKSTAIDRTMTDGYDRGVIRLILSPKGTILGACALLPNAGEVLQEYVLAMQANVPIRTVGGSVHAYPTVAQANRRVANQYLGAKFLTPRTKRIVQFLAQFRR